LPTQALACVRLNGNRALVRVCTGLAADVKSAIVQVGMQ